MNKKAASASKVTGKTAKKPRPKHGLGPRQAKGRCKWCVLTPEPPGLPLDQVKALMIRLMQEDMDAIEPLRKVMADAAVPMFELIWTDPTLGFLSRNYTLLDMLMNANCFEVLVAFSNIARNECYPAYERLLQCQCWGAILHLSGVAVGDRALEVLKRIAPPQSEAQALAMFDYKNMHYMPPALEKIWTDAAEDFLAEHGHRAIAAVTAIPKPTGQPPEESNKRL